MRAAPTPPGVPVTMTSPGRSVRPERAVGDQLRHVEDHVLELGVLHDLAVQPRLDALRAERTDLVRRHQIGPERAGAGEVLARDELGGVPLEVPDRDVVVAGEPGDVLQRLVLRDVVRVGADHHGELALVVDGFGDLWPHDRLPVADLGVGEAGEHRRVAADRPACLGAVVLVVDADADDLVRVRDHRIERDRAPGMVGRGAGEGAGALEPARAQQRLQRGRAQAGLQVDDAGVGGEAEAGLAARPIGEEFHAAL